MKYRAVALVLGLAALAAVAVYVRRGSGPSGTGPQEPASGPVRDPRPVAAPGPARPGPRPATKGPSSAPATGQETPFAFDDRRPLIDQVRPLLKAVDYIEPSAWKACRERAADVAAAVVVLLKDASLSSNEREMGLGLLRELKVDATLPDILEVARKDVDEDIRATAVRTLGAFGRKVSVDAVAALYAGAKSVSERIAAVDVLGELGDASALPLLDAAAKSAPDTTLLEAASQAAQKVRIETSPKREVEWVQILHQPEHPLRDWSLARIVAEKKVDLAHHLRKVLEEHRRLPEGRRLAYFEVELLRGLEVLGETLGPADRKVIDDYGRPPETEFRD